MMASLEELSAKHKKEIKALEGEKRAAIKNAKSRGKKAKAIVKETEFKYEGLERDMKERHRLEIEELTSGGDDGDGGNNNGSDGAQDELLQKVMETTTQQQSAQQPKEEIDEQQQQQTPEEIEEAKRQKAIAKKLKKKQAQKQRDLDREKRIAEENAQAGPSRRLMEMEALQTLYLHPRNLEVEEVDADGNCLYRAVGVQCRRLGMDTVVDMNHESSSGDCYTKMRSICADVLLGSNRAEYEPFAEFGEGHDSDDGGNHPATYEEYVNNVRSTSTWGGQLELRALSEGLKCPIVVFSAEGPPLTMGAEFAEDEVEGDDKKGWDKKKALLLSFHRYYYALGEHYNSVIPK